MDAVAEAAEGDEMTRIENKLRMNLSAIQGRKTDEEMAHMIGEKSRATWKDRIKNPKNLKIGELLEIAQKANVPFETLFFGTIERRY